MKNTSKYMFLASKCCEQVSKSCRNSVFGCPDHFFEFLNRFPIGFGYIKVYKLDFEIFVIFGHSGRLLRFSRRHFLAPKIVKKAKKCNDGALARAYEIRKIQKVSEMKDMMPLSILCTHMSRTEVTC